MNAPEPLYCSAWYFRLADSLAAVIIPAAFLVAIVAAVNLYKSF